LFLGIRLIIHASEKTNEREMDRMFIAVISGILEGLLICSGMFTQNALMLGAAIIFFVIQWRYLGKTSTANAKKDEAENKAY